MSGRSLIRGWRGEDVRQVFRTGANKQIVYRHDDDALVHELLKSPVGYLVCSSRYVERLIDHGGIDLVKKLGVKLWIHVSDYRDPEVVKALKEIGSRLMRRYQFLHRLIRPAR